jgi:Malonyl-CoA decarboxylase C-terminal domain/Malonate decarboxylase, alpha subunit, transporter
MPNTPGRGTDRASRLARGAALSGTSGKLRSTDQATLLLEAIVEPGDRVAIEGDNQKQADFLASALALIYVGVALMEGPATSMTPLLSQGMEEDTARARALLADTAIFYSISNCQNGLRSVSFGNFLIKQVIEELQRPA